MLSLTLAVLLAMTGIASAAHGLGEADHSAMKHPGEGHGPAAGLDECCDATGGGGGNCLVDAALAGGSACLSAAVSQARPVAGTRMDLDGRIAAVPTGPPKV